jgi:hypothetical protein
MLNAARVINELPVEGIAHQCPTRHGIALVLHYNLPYVAKLRFTLPISYASPFKRLLVKNGLKWLSP